LYAIKYLKNILFSNQFIIIWLWDGLLIMIVICYTISKTRSPGLVEPCTPFSIVRFSENNRHKSWAFRAPYKLGFVFTSLLFLVIKRGNGPGSITPFVSSRVMFFCNDNPCRFSPFNSLGNAVWHETLNITVNKKNNGWGKNKNKGATRVLCACPGRQY